MKMFKSLQLIMTKKTIVTTENWIKKNRKDKYRFTVMYLGSIFYLTQISNL